MRLLVDRQHDGSERRRPDPRRPSGNHLSLRRDAGAQTTAAALTEGRSVHAYGSLPPPEEELLEHQLGLAAVDRRV
jgi:hypothetical protein